MEMVHIAIVRPDIDYRREPTSKTGRERTFEQSHLLDGFRRENGESSQQVVGIVNRYAVQQNQVLIWCLPGHTNR